MTTPILSVTKEHPGYPSLLSAAAGAPDRLYFCGSLECLAAPCVSMVGSRRISAYGEKVVRHLVPALARAGLTVVSGLAYGIDGEVQRVALENGGRCAAVVGSGPDVVYPLANRAIRDRILKSCGCVLSEYPPGMPPLRHHFPERNRIVAALSPVTVIIEAGDKSGTLITARNAADAGREVCVVPGDIFRDQSAGINGLLKQGVRPVTSAEDILALYSDVQCAQIALDLHPALTGSPAALYDLISQGAESAEALVAATGLKISEVQSVLSVLELDGYIRCKASRWLKTS